MTGRVPTHVAHGAFLRGNSRRSQHGAGRCALGVGALLLLFGALPAQIPNGFLDLVWGTSIENVRQRYVLRSMEGDQGHTRFKADIADVGGAAVDECQIEFSGGKFSGVVLITRGRENTRALLHFLQALYGSGFKENDRAYQWFAGKTHFSYDEDSAGDGYIYGYCIASQENVK